MAVAGVASPAIALTMAVAAASLVQRFRRSRGSERQQLRWLALAAALAPPVVLATAAAIATGNLILAGWAIGLYLALLPLAIAAAIARYRLYDLDRIISRTLAYGLLTLLLGAGYAGVVLGLGRLLPGSSSLAVAAATLATAAVFQPARRRIQRAVDRRFNRRRYDAARTIEAFSARLRDEVDLDTLSGELLTVIEQTCNRPERRSGSGRKPCRLPQPGLPVAGRPPWNDRENDRDRSLAGERTKPGAVQSEDRNALGTDGGHTGTSPTRLVTMPGDRRAWMRRGPCQ
jgi:hypothetical protein